MDELAIYNSYSVIYFVFSVKYAAKTPHDSTISNISLNSLIVWLEIFWKEVSLENTGLQ